MKLARTALFATALATTALWGAGGHAQQSDQPLPEAPAGQDLASAEMSGPEGEAMGTVALAGTPNGILLQVRMEQVPPGGHGIHIHETGTCEGPDFQSAGGHFAPQGHSHGFLSPEGPHAGDLPNVFVGEDGVLRADILTDRVSLGTGETGLNKPEGTAIVLHSGVDDYMTDPSGDSGNRIACGPIVANTQP